MTEENYNYRTSQKLLRNQFPGKGKLKIPIIPKFQESPGDFDDLLLIGFDKTHLEDQNHLDRMVHFFLYDYRFERVWKNPDNDIEKLSRYRAVLSPDFSMYLEMAPVMQLYNVFRNPKGSGSFQLSTGEMNPRLISALKGLKKEALLLSPLIWPQSMTTAATRKNGSWQDTTRCCGALIRKKLSVIIHRFPKCRATLSMWITNAVLGGI